MPFQRGLENSFIDLLQRENWWGDVRVHPELAIAIRNGYLNVYSNGQSILMVSCTNNSLKGHIHYKYLVNVAKPEYRSFKNDKFNTEGLFFIQKYDGKILSIN
jgi:hypothetical protein